jgi:hypothetical protein
MEEGEIEVDSIEPIRVSGYYPGVGAGVWIPWRAGLAQGGETWPRREDLFNPVPLCAAAGQAKGAA